MNTKTYSNVGGIYMHKKSIKKNYRIIDSWMKNSGVPERRDPNNPASAWWLLFEGDKKACQKWICDGMLHTEGAERDHYCDLLIQLESGKKELDYRRI